MLNCKIKAPCKEHDYFFFDFKIDDEALLKWLGEFEKLELLSGDYLFVTKGYKNYEDKPNHCAASLLGEPVYGDCVLVERDDYVASRVRT